MDQAILRKWLQAGFMDKHVLYPTEAGVPHGGVVSPVIMHLALNGLERHITAAFPTFQGGARMKVHAIRFADAFISTGRSKAFLEEAVRPLVASFLAVSPAQGEPADFGEGRPGALSPLVAVGAASTPAQIPPRDSGQVWPD
jgi:RNA-directed DNA polymerase